MNTTTLTLGRASLLGRRTWFDWVFAALIVLGAGFAWQKYQGSMDIYERWILVGSVPSMIALGWFWAPLRGLSLAVGATTLMVISSTSSSTSIQCRTGTSVPLCRCVMQPTLALRMALGVSASRWPSLRSRKVVLMPGLSTL